MTCRCGNKDFYKEGIEIYCSKCFRHLDPKDKIKYKRQVWYKRTVIEVQTIIGIDEIEEIKTCDKRASERTSRIKKIKKEEYLSKQREYAKNNYWRKKLEMSTSRV